jgi:phosphoglycolate phosphatase-like HAD superfamily hydrolase
LISDLDGTIADTAPVIFESLHVVCGAFDIDLDGRDLSFALGPPLHWVLEEIGVADERMSDAIAVFETAHTERMSLVVPMPGAEIVIPELAAAGVAIGVATIKPKFIAKVVLRTIGLGTHIHALHARADDMDPRTKTDLVRGALAELPGSEPLYVGDHDNDELAARELGIPFLRYPDVSWNEIRTAVLGA